MGFYVMVCSLIFGCCLLAWGISYRKRNLWYKSLIVVGIILIALSVLLAFPH